MASRSVVVFTTGPAGTGKTYNRGPRFLLREFLPQRSGVHWSNFPFGAVPADHVAPPRHEGETFRERLAGEAARRGSGDVDEYLDRIQVIPADEIERWRLGESGPWDFFRDRDLAGAHIAIDEIHNFCGRGTHHKIRKHYQSWLGEIRHRGATVEFLSQSPNKVAKEISWEAAEQIQLRSAESIRDPFFGIALGDWYELRAKFLTREYDSQILIQHLRQGFGGRWKMAHSERVRIDPEYFQYFDSFSSPHAGGSSGQTEKHEWQKRGPVGLLAWFGLRHAWALASRLAIVAALVFLLSGGGGPLMGLVLGVFELGAGGGEAQADVSAPPAHVAAAAGPSSAPVAGSDVTDAQPVPSPAIVAAREELHAVRQRLEAAQRRIERASAVVLLTHDQVTFRDGYSYGVGEVIDYGPYLGQTIEEIDYERRSVRLASGVVLRMGRPGGGLSPPPADGASQARVPGDL